MTDMCGVALDGGHLAVGKERFPARQTVCGKDIPEAFETSQFDEAVLAERDLRFALMRQEPMEVIPVFSPSQVEVTGRAMPEHLETRTIAPGVRVSGGELALAADRGTAIHDAFRILLQRPDLKERVAAHCRMEPEDVDALALQAEGLRRALAEQGYTDLHVEQPLEIALADGGRQSAIIDLLAEGPGGYMIVDHKSGAVTDYELRFATYWPQLAAYVDAVEAVGTKPVRDVAIFWTDMGEFSVCELSKAVS